MRKLKLFLDAKAANTPPRGISKASRVIFSVLTLLLLSVGNVWAESVTFSAVYANQDKPTSYEGTDFSISFDKNGGTATQYYNTGYALRAYAKNRWTFSSTKTITGIAFTFGSGDGSNTITASTGTYADGSWEGSASEITFSVGGTSGHRRIASVEVTFAVGPSDACAKPTFSPAAGAVLSGTEVSISCATEGATVHYTLDGSDPTASSATAQPISITSATTIKAIAVKDGMNNSSVASASYTIATPLASMEEIFAASATAGNYYITFNSNWVVTGVSSNGKNVYITDGTKGMILYNDGGNIGLAAGNTLSGTKQCSLTRYGGAAEISNFSIAGLTKGTGTLPAVQELSEEEVAALSAVNTGALIKVSGEYTSDGYVGGAKLYNAIMALPTMTGGSTYECTGVYIYYKKNNTTAAVPEIAPRTENDIKEVQAATLTEVNGLAELKAAELGSYYVNLTNAVVSYVNGNNALIEDANAGALIYLSNHGFNAGDCLNGKYQVTTTDHQGKFEITAIEAQTGAAKTTAEIPLTTLTITQLNANFSSYESRRVKIVGANVTDAISGDDRNGAINDGAAVAVYAAAGKNVITLTADDNVDIIGYPGYYNTDEQLNVWRQEDITVNVKEDPELAYNPAVVNVLLSDLASFTPADLEYATGFDGVAAITYESSDPSIATVGETTGVVEVVATAEGSATITATFGGNSTYKADNASYTINVSVAPIAPVYTMSFDLTRASYDDAADAQVVWNSNVVTMTADKNDGTKVTNYLAGNYTGTTLIAETRFYAKNSISFVPQEGVSITKIEWMSTAKGYATNLAAETFVNATAAVDGTDDKLVIITPSAAGEISVTLTAPARATAVTVYYEAESEKAKLDASIAIANINTAVGDDDILLSDIAATSNPNKKAISYAITSGTAVSLVGEGKDAAFHAVEAGTATITATIPNDLGNYTGATQTFDIIVSAGPATLESIAISGTASVLEYTEGQYFNPAGLVVTGHYSDNTDAEISEGITWAFDPSPLTVGTTSVSVTATVSEISSSAFEVNGLTVSAAAAPTTDNVVILAVYDEKYYAMSTTNANNGFTAIAVEYDGSQITVKSEAEKTAIQWTRTTNGDNTTFQDADSKYMKSADGASMSLDANECNWLWDATGGYYKISGTSRTFFFQNTSGGIFKNYAVSNFDKTGYSNKAQVIVIDPENIVITAKVSAELAYDPASDEITQGDAWTAPALVNPHSVTITSYASDNEAVATVDGGVIALAGGIGTAHITAHFDGDASYLDGDAVYTITVNAVPEPADVCDGTDDFITATNTSASSYNVERTTTDGWHSVNSALTTIEEEARWLTMLGKTSQVGAITSPTLNDGIASLKIRYANTFNESNGVSFRVDIKQGEDVVKTYTVTKANADVEKGTVYTELIENINVAGDFQIVITNLSPSNADSNKDRVSIGRLCWSNYDGPTDFGSYHRDVMNGNYGTICLPKAGVISGATLFDIEKFENGMIYCLEVNDGNMEAGKPYIFQATSDQLNVVYSAAATVVASEANGLHGYYDLNNMATDEAAHMDLAQNDGNYILYQNQYWLVDGRDAYINNFRAYIKLAEIQPLQNSNGAPRRRVAMTVHGEQVVTGIDALNAAEAPIKVMINGQIFILRGEKMYDATGRLVK